MIQNMIFQRKMPFFVAITSGINYPGQLWTKMKFFFPCKQIFTKSGDQLEKLLGVWNIEQQRQNREGERTSSFVDEFTAMSQKKAFTYKNKFCQIPDDAKPVLLAGNIGLETYLS